MKHLILGVILLLLLPCAASGQAAEDGVSRVYGVYDTDALRRSVPEEAEDAVRGLRIDGGITLDDGLQNLWEQGRSVIRESYRPALRMLLLLLVVSMLMGLAGGLWDASGAMELPLTVTGVLAVAAVSLGDFHQLIGLTQTTVRQIESFSKVLLPILTSATAAAGAPTGAAARQAATVLFSDVLITVINRLLIPCTYACIAALTANAALGNKSLAAVAKFIKWAVGGVLKLLLTLYVAYLTISGAVAGSSDAMIERSAKLAISGMIPVVGGILSEASQTIVAGAGLVRSSVGVFGLIAVLGVTLVPLIRIGLQYAVYKLAAAVCAQAAPAPVMAYMESLSEVFGLLLGMTASASMLLLISIVSCMMAGVS